MPNKMHDRLMDQTKVGSDNLFVGPEMFRDCAHYLTSSNLQRFSLEEDDQV